jgi:hypothetical protein
MARHLNSHQEMKEYVFQETKLKSISSMVTPEFHFLQKRAEKNYVRLDSTVYLLPTSHFVFYYCILLLFLCAVLRCCRYYFYFSFIYGAGVKTKSTIATAFYCLPLWSSGQTSWLQIQGIRLRFQALPHLLRCSGSGTGFTQPREAEEPLELKVAAPV